MAHPLPHAQDVVGVVRALLEPVADPTRAPAMTAYMRGVAPFLGVTSPARRAATRDWVRSFEPGPRARALLATADELVRAPQREFAYVAIDLVRRHERELPGPPCSRCATSPSNAPGGTPSTPGPR